MRGKILALGGVLILAATAASAQEMKVSTPTYDDIYCSGRIDGEQIPTNTFIITGEGSDTRITFQQNDYVYVNKGTDQGVKVGDELLAMRPVSDPTLEPYFKWQFTITKKIGQMWEDEGRLKVVVAQPNASVAQVVHACNYIQRGDILLPAADRPVPPLKPAANFDRFAPPSGKALAMVLIGRYFHVELGTNDIMYVNLGANQGVKVGDYFRVFRYTGQEDQTAFQEAHHAFEVEGFGGVSSAKYKWDNVPREVLGEGVVITVTPNSATVLLTFSLREIFSGDYVELE